MHSLTIGVAGMVLGIGIPGARAEKPGANLALVAEASTSFVSGHETLGALNDGAEPAHSDDKRRGAYGNWPRTGTQWVEYTWSQPVATRRMDVYWFDDERGVRLPAACRLKHWDGRDYVAVPGVEGMGLEKNRFNTTTYPEITTTRLRLEFDGVEKYSTGLLEWRVYDSGSSPNFPPTLNAGAERVVVLPGRTHLDATARDDGKPAAGLKVRWVKESGPGRVTFEDDDRLSTSARFSEPGVYGVRLIADDGAASATGTVRVTVDPPPPRSSLRPVPVTRYRVTSPLWKGRVKALITNWIPHCIRKIEDPATPEGGIGNFVEAGRKLTGQAGAKHTGPVFANAWVYNTLESICLALQVDPAGDPEIAAAQAAMRKTMDDWIWKILSAQEPDGYLHTMYTIEGRPRWSNKHDHEDYQAGYFIEAAIAHDRLTGGTDLRMYEAAKRLADCWRRNIGPAPKRAWYPGHQAMEMALARLAGYVEESEGRGRGRPYVEMAKFLLDSRRDGEEYDQSHLPVTRQYEAVGHAVRAVYSYAGMADVAIETGDADYLSASRSLWHSVVNRKYYVTGGVGSGETSEGFGKEFSLPNNAYCESCAGCGEIFFQHRLLRAFADARYADLYEETLYNAVLGSIDLEGRNFTYTNPLDSDAKRYPWHGCPCCVGNIPRTLLSLPSWVYAADDGGLFVNLYAGCAVTIDGVAGRRVEVAQETDYPWSGRVSITVTPDKAARFAVRLRAPNRRPSALYATDAAGDGITSITVNGEEAKPAIERGYAVLKRTWKAGDRIELELPLPVQRVTADERIAATRGRVALRRGPLVYNIESVDQNVDSVLPPAAVLSGEWQPDLLGGVVVVKGAFADGSPLLAVPNFARLNRGGRSLVWIRDR